MLFTFLVRGRLVVCFQWTMSPIGSCVWTCSLQLGCYLGKLENFYMLDPCWKKGFWGLALRFYSQALISVHCLLPKYRGNGIIWPPHLPRLHASHHDRKCPSDCKTEKTETPSPLALPLSGLAQQQENECSWYRSKLRGRPRGMDAPPLNWIFVGRSPFFQKEKS